MKRMNKVKAILVLTSVLVLLMAVVGSTIAFLTDQTDSVTNTFTPAKVTVSVNDTVSGKTKSNIVITNTGNTSAYIRATLVANWVDKDGNIVAPCDLSTEGTMVGLPGTNWTESNGFYYYTKPVDAGASTPDALFTSYTAGETPEGADHLEMKIIAQGVQAEPISAVTEAWGWTPSEQ